MALGNPLGVRHPGKRIGAQHRSTFLGLTLIVSLVFSACSSTRPTAPPTAPAPRASATHEATVKQASSAPTLSVEPTRAAALDPTTALEPEPTASGSSRVGTEFAQTIPDPAVETAEPAQAAAETAPAERREVVVHTVGEGEMLSTIAEQYGVSWESIVAINGLTSEDELAIGQKLRIPPVSGVIHKVQPGDTLEAIAALYGAEVMPIVVMNGLDNPDSLETDQELIIPGGTPPARGLLASRGGQRSGPLKPGTYVVKEGDSLGSIADRFGISVETLLWANQVSDPDSIQVGDELVVLPVSGALYTVKPGDTINTIASKSGVSAGEIMMANGIDDPQSLQVGAKLLLPGGKPIRDPQPEPPKPTATPQPAPPKPAPQAAPQPPAPAPAAPAPAPASGTLGQKTISIAQQYIGYPYVWGGTGPRSFDCTGFVYFIFNKQLGLSMPRDLWGQLGSGKRVDRANVQAGDLVFFQNTYQPGLSHVGIALDNTRFIHAASESYGVMVSRLNDSYWAARWYAASRP